MAGLNTVNVGKTASATNLWKFQLNVDDAHSWKIVSQFLQKTLLKQIVAVWQLEKLMYTYM